MSNKLSDNVKNGSREAVDAVQKKKAAAAASAKQQYQKQQQEKFKNGRLNNWKYVTVINFVIAVLFIGLAIRRYLTGAYPLIIIILAVFGLLNLACGIWNIFRFRGKAGQVDSDGKD